MGVVVVVVVGGGGGGLNGYMRWLIFKVVKPNSNCFDTKSGFYVPLNNQGHFETVPQHGHLWDSNHRGESL